MGPLSQKGHRLHCLLGIETSGDLCSVAVGRDASVLSKKSISMPYGQAGHLMGLIQEVLTASETSWKQLDGVVVNRGPGSFTGLRVGLAVAQGISLAGGIPSFGLTGFAIYRSLENMEKNFLVLIDTRRDDCFVGFFEAGELDPSFETVMSYEEISVFYASQNNLHVVGNVDAVLIPGLISGREIYPLEAEEGLRSFRFYRERDRSDFSSEPYYLRDPEIHGKQIPL